MNGWALADLERRLANMVTIGTIDQVDHDTKQIRVKTVGTTTAWLPWPAEVGRNFIRWRPLRPGQQVVLVAPSGELAQAVVVGMLYTSAQDAPNTDPNVDMVQFEDGTVVRYDSAAAKMTASVRGDVDLVADGNLDAQVGGDLSATVGGNATAKVTGSTTVTCPTIQFIGNVTITGVTTLVGPLVAGPGAAGQGATLEGDFTLVGSLDATNGDITADGISLKQHVHPENDNGGPTGPPQ